MGRVAGTAAFEPNTVAYRTDDLDEAVEFVGRHFAPHSRVPRARGPLGYDICISVAERSACGSSTAAVPTTLRAATRGVTVHLPAGHENAYRIGRRSLTAAPDIAVLLCPGHDYTVDTPPGTVAALVLEPSLLEREIDLLCVRRPRTWSLRSQQLPLSPADVAAFRELIGRHGRAVRSEELAQRIDELRALEDRFASWLARRIVAASGLVELSPSNRQVVERIDAWIRAHVAQPISLDELRAVAGVSARTLQEACLARWGQTPIELVVSRRLEIARSLLSSGRAPTVTAAALQSGFSHLGRFSVAYKRTFGETPSETLARTAAVRATPRTAMTAQ
jgi:AraC-like DNA-binding protein